MRRPTQTYGRRRSLLGGRLPILLLGLAGLAFYWFSNQQTVPFSDRKQLITIPIDQASQMGLQSYAQILQQEGRNVLCLEGGQCPQGAPEVVAEVRKIGERLEVAAIQLEDELIAAGYKFTPVARDFDWQYNVILSEQPNACLLYTSPSPRDRTRSRMPSSA